ncbi:hypothetical protein ACJJI3_12525 [Microbulbifer sp. ZKSA004]|uniref:hypothetical protein n=1 Tax=Microbulbifer sp. ZKSA004 TaxID=3243389 RepID=UPI0040394F1D
MLQEDQTQLALMAYRLLPVLAGAIIGILGSLIGTTYAQSLKDKQEKLKNKKEKLEKFVSETYEIDVWLQKLRNYHLFGGDEVLEMSPLSKVEALQALYFPELGESVEQLSSVIQEYTMWLIKGAKLRVNSESAVPPQEYLSEMADAYSPVIHATKEVIKNAVELSKSFDKPSKTKQKN